MNNYSEIILTKPLLECIAYIYCKEINIQKYLIPLPTNKIINELIKQRILNGEGTSVIDKEFGYACYEYYRQRNMDDFFDKLLIKYSKNRKMILDLCCGPGATVRSLINNNSPETIYAMDSNPKYISIIKDIYFENSCIESCVVPILGDVHNIPLENESVDYVICRVALQYLNVDIVLAEIYRVLAKRGKVFLLVHGSGYLLNYIFSRGMLLKKETYSSMRKILNGSKSASQAKFLTSHQLTKKMNQNGFIDVELITNQFYKEFGIFPVYFAVCGSKE